MALVPLAPELCPDCGLELVHYETRQPALFAHGAYGATDKTVLVMCAGCGYGRQRERSEINPKGTA